MYDSKVSTKGGTANLFYDPTSDKYKATVTRQSDDIGYETVAVESEDLVEVLQGIKKATNSPKIAGLVARRFFGQFNSGVRQMRNQLAAAKPVVKDMMLDAKGMPGKVKVHDKKKKIKPAAEDSEVEEAEAPVKKKKKHSSK